MLCSLCHTPGQADIHCFHEGTWHLTFSDCSLSCAVLLGASNLGQRHWSTAPTIKFLFCKFSVISLACRSCCGSTKHAGVCSKAWHVFQTIERKENIGDLKGANGTEIGEKSDCPLFFVNLDAPPEVRWNHIILEYKDRLRGVLSTIDEILGAGTIRGLAESAFSGINTLGRFYYSSELEGISKASGLSTGQVAMLQIAYEAFAACTSILVNMKDTQQNGNSYPFHIRTMDWEMPALQRLTIEVDFVRQGVPIFRATTWPGYVGVLTGMRFNSFSVSVNYRRSQEGHRDMLGGLLTNMLEGLKGNSWPISFLVREVLDQHTYFEQAAGALQSSTLMASTYIIIGGMVEDEGFVITRGRSGNERWPQVTLAHGPCVQANMDFFRDDDLDGLHFSPGGGEVSNGYLYILSSLYVIYDIKWIYLSNLPQI
jgi:hypothetical protein